MAILHVLILEDQPFDVELMLHELRRAGYTTVWQQVDTEADYLAALDSTLDLIIADYILPGFDALRALDLLHASGLHIPFVVVSGSIGEDVAVAAMRRGATDYLLKDRIPRLGATVANALEQYRLRAESQRAQELQHESEAKYRMLFESMEEAYILADVLFDQENKPVDVLYLEANPAAVKMTGNEMIGRRMCEFYTHLEPHWFELLGRVMKTGLREHIELPIAQLDMWLYISVFKVDGPNTTQIAAVYKDITDRKRREANSAFLDDIMADFAVLETADDIMRVGCAKIMAYFDVSRCSLGEINELAGEIKIIYDESAYGLPSVVGVHRIADFHTQDEMRELTAGHAIVINDVVSLERTAEAIDRFAQIGIGAVAIASYMSEGKWKFVLSATRTMPRVWRDDEIELLQELSARIWLRIERARSEEALRVSEKRYHTLFESIDEGFCIIEMLFSDTGDPFDYRFVEANPALTQQTGLVNVTGRTVRELIPEHETHWYEIFGDVATTGEAVRFELPAPNLQGKWFDVYAFRVGEPSQHRVAILFNDVSRRRHVELALRESEAQVRQLIEGVPQLIWTATPDGYCDYFSPQWVKYTGIPVGKLVGKGWLAQIHPDDLVLLSDWDAVAALDGNYLVEFRIRRHDGAYRWFVSQAAPVKNEDGNIIKWFGTNTDIEERKRDQATLQHYANQMHRLSHQLVEVQEAERRKIAYELHDQVGQMLTGLKLMLDGTRTHAVEQLPQPLTEARTAINDLLSRVRNMSLDLRPSMLDDMGLIPALKWLIERYTAQTSVQVRWWHQGLDRRFPTPIETSVYRIMQEALTNVARHAAADAVEVRLMVDDEQILMQIDDEGCGFDLEAAHQSRQSIGLLGMQERVTLLGGTFEVDSYPGHGTHLNIIIPLISVGS